MAAAGRGKGYAAAGPGELPLCARTVRAGGVSSWRASGEPGLGRPARVRPIPAGVLLGLIRPQGGRRSSRRRGEEGPACVGLRIRPSCLCALGKAAFSGHHRREPAPAAPDADDQMLEEALRTACAYEFVSRLPSGDTHPLGEQGRKTLLRGRTNAFPSPARCWGDARSCCWMRPPRRWMRERPRPGCSSNT